MGAGGGGTRLNRQILRLAIPSLLASITVPLIGIADTAMIGRLEDVAFLGAVATASTIFDVMFWSAGFLRMGTTSLVAQYFGAGNRSACGQVLFRSLMLAVVLGTAMLVAREGIADIGFGLAAGSDGVQSWGRRYFTIRSWGVPLALIVFTLNGFFLGTANALAPLCLTLVATVVNVTADYVLIFGVWGAPRLGVEGAAWAAVGANVVAVIIGVGILLCRYREYLHPGLLDLFERQRIVQLLHTNFTLLGRTLCLLSAQYTMLGMASRMGEVSLAANAIIWQIWSLVSYGVDGFAHAAETLVGTSLGGREFVRARMLARRILWWGLGIGIVFAAVYACGIGYIARSFTHHEAVIGLIVGLSWHVALVQPLNAVVFVFDGVFIGANDLSYLFRAMAVAVFGVFVPVAWLCVGVLDWGLQGAWLAYIALMLGRFWTLFPRYLGDRWQHTFIP